MKKRLTVLMVLSLLIASTVAGRAVYIQILGDERLEKLAKRQFNSKMLVQARRGVIVDRSGEPLAINTEVQSLAANPSKVQNKKMMAKLLSKALGIPHEKLLARLKEKREFIWIKRHLPDEQIEQFKKWGITDVSGNLLPGFWLVKENFRRYPHGELASHVIGTVNLDSEGTEGVELWKNSKLEGKVVAMSSVKDALGRPTLYDASAVRDAKDGETIQLTLDASLQFAVEEELKLSLEKTKARAGAVIVMDAISGDILALANAPTFNPNVRGAPAENRRNRVLTDAFEPGSTLKPILLAGALNQGWKITDRLHGEHGSFKVQGKRISEAETHEKFEWIDLKKMIQVSSNVVSAKLAMKMGADKYMSTLRSFGFGEKSGTGFPGELSGWLPNAKKTWSPLTLANVGFGQGIMVTPIQMLRAYTAFVNGGWLVQPRLVKDPNKDEDSPAPIRAIPANVAEQVVDAMKTVTASDGTGKKAALEGYIVAGKTGTAQTVDAKTKKYSRSRYISSFIGFPVGVEPRIVIMTLLDEPKGVYYASETAAPLFKNVLNAVVTRFAIPSSSPIERKLAEAESKKNSKKKDTIQASMSQATPPAPTKLELSGTSPEGKIVWKMPSLEGMTAREALQILQGNDLRLEFHGNGLIQSQSPEAGTTITEGSLIKLRLENEL